MMRFAASALAARGVGAERTYVSMERNMQCGIGHCGHCQLGPTLVCRDGPVYRWSEIGPWLAIREL
jgi:NAD(P)H-flavin reductase